MVPSGDMTAGMEGAIDGAIERLLVAVAEMEGAAGDLLLLAEAAGAVEVGVNEGASFVGEFEGVGVTGDEEGVAGALLGDDAKLGEGVVPIGGGGTIALVEEGEGAAGVGLGA
jgi:hypothetical protein